MKKRKVQNSNLTEEAIAAIKVPMFDEGKRPKYFAEVARCSRTKWAFLIRSTNGRVVLVATKPYRSRAVALNVIKNFVDYVNRTPEHFQLRESKNY